MVGGIDIEIFEMKGSSFIPGCVSSLRTLSNPSSPPQAMYPCSRFQARHRSLTLFGMAIL